MQKAFDHILDRARHKQLPDVQAIAPPEMWRQNRETMHQTQCDNDDDPAENVFWQYTDATLNLADGGPDPTSLADGNMFPSPSDLAVESRSPTSHVAGGLSLASHLDWGHSPTSLENGGIDVMSADTLFMDPAEGCS